MRKGLSAGSAPFDTSSGLYITLGERRTAWRTDFSPSWKALGSWTEAAPVEDASKSSLKSASSSARSGRRKARLATREMTGRAQFSQVHPPASGAAPNVKVAVSVVVS